MIHNPNQFDAQQHSSQSASNQPVSPLEDKETYPLENWHTPKEDAFKGLVYLSKSVEQHYHSMVCFVGYGLLGLALVDYISVIIPPHFTDPVWEFQTIGALVEHAAIPLVGLLFVFYRHQGYIRKHERNFLGFLSWLSLLVGLLYLLMLPLGVANTWRIYQYNNTQIAAQLSQQSQQFQQFRGKLNQAKTDKEVEQLVASLAPQGGSLQAENTQAVKDQVLAKIAQAEQSMKAQANSMQTNQSQTLNKNSVKWNLGALVCGTLFIWIWYRTKWSRRVELK